VDARADRELLELRLAFLDLLRLDEVDVLEVARRAELPHELRDRLVVESLPGERHAAARLAHVGQPELLGRRDAEVVEHVDRALALALEDVDGRELRAELRAALVEEGRLLVALGEVGELGLVGVGLLLDAIRFAPREELAAQERQHETRREERDDLLVALASRLPARLGARHEVDADHASPGRRVPSPTATASEGAMVSSATESTLRPRWTRANGFASSTGASSFSPRRSITPGTRAPPPAT